MRGVGYRFAEADEADTEFLMKRHLIVKLLAINLVVIGFVIVVVWLYQHPGAGYFVTLMEKYNISPEPAHAMFVSSIHRYLIWASWAVVLSVVELSDDAQGAGTPYSHDRHHQRDCIRKLCRPGADGIPRMKSGNSPGHLTKWPQVSTRSRPSGAT